MAETATKLPVKTERTAARPAVAARWPIVSLHREIDRLFEDFDRGFWGFPMERPTFDMEPLWQRAAAFGALPAVDVSEDEKAYEITAELPGMDEKNIEVKLSNGTLTIKGERTAEREEKKKDYHLQERNYGSFERSFQLPNGVDKNKIEANFDKGILKVSLPKTAEAQKAEKKIAIKTA
jgi:HSP20 family protein